MLILRPRFYPFPSQDDRTGLLQNVPIQLPLSPVHSHLTYCLFDLKFPFTSRFSLSPTFRFLLPSLFSSSSLLISCTSLVFLVKVFQWVLPWAPASISAVLFILWDDTIKIRISFCRAASLLLWDRSTESWGASRTIRKRKIVEYEQ